MKKTLNVAMIGGGFMGRAHSNAWKKVSSISVLVSNAWKTVIDLKILITSWKDV